MTSLVLYYSRTRKTAQVAETLARELESDIIEIKDLKPRKSVLNYISASIDAFRENKTEISPKAVDLSSYDQVYLGTPVWAGRPTPAIVSLIDNCNFQDKDVILFATMGGSGGENTIDRMKEKIELRGGRIITFFSLKTSGKQISEIKDETKKIIEEMDLKIYES